MSRTSNAVTSSNLVTQITPPRTSGVHETGSTMYVVSTSGSLEPSLEPLMSIKLTKKILGISEKTLRDWVWRKKIDYVKPGSRVMFEPEAIRQFIENNRVKAHPRVM